MYTSKYYTCEQIDQRLLQGYYDDAVAAGYKGTKDEFVSGLNNAVSNAIKTAKAISFDPTHTLVDFKNVQAALEELLQDVGRVDITELDSMTSADHAKSKGPIFYKVTASLVSPNNKMNVGILLVNSDNLGHLLRQTLITQYLLTEEGAIDTTAHDHEFHEYTRYRLFHSEDGTESTWTAWEDIFGNINKEVNEVATNLNTYDATADHNGTKYTFEELMANDGALIPEKYRRGGLTLKFINKDDEHVSMLLNNPSWSTNQGWVTVFLSLSTAIGLEAQASGDSDTALGYGANAHGDTSVAIGNQANAGGQESTAVGPGTQASGSQSMAIGTQASARGNSDISIGAHSYTWGHSSIAIGGGAAAPYNSSIAIGGGASAPSDSAIAIGYKAKVSYQNAPNATAVGPNAVAKLSNSTAFGTIAKANGENTTAVGPNATAEGESSTAVGYDTVATGNYSVAIGVNAETTGHYCIAIGSATANENDSIAIGSATADYESSTAIGNQAETGGEYAIALGNNVANTKSIFSVGFNGENGIDMDRDNYGLYLKGFGGYDGTNLVVTTNTVEKLNPNIKSVQEIINEKADLVNGKIKTDQLPNEIIINGPNADGNNSYYVDISEGHFAYRSDGGKTFMVGSDNIVFGNTTLTEADLNKITTKLENITDATSAEEVVTKFNSLLADLKAKGFMKA